MKSRHREATQGKRKYTTLYGLTGHNRSKKQEAKRLTVEELDASFCFEQRQNARPQAPHSGRDGRRICREVCGELKGLLPEVCLVRDRWRDRSSNISSFIKDKAIETCAAKSKHKASMRLQGIQVACRKPTQTLMLASSNIRHAFRPSHLTNCLLMVVCTSSPDPSGPSSCSSTGTSMGSSGGNISGLLAMLLHTVPIARRHPAAASRLTVALSSSSSTDSAAASALLQTL